MKKSNAGFSLIELMVVVAIIGILATIAIPNFQKFQGRAKQSSAKSELAGIYTAEKSFYAEYSQFHPNLSYVGFVGDGITLDPATNCPNAVAGAAKRYYTVGFTDATGNAAVGSLPTPCATANFVISYPANLPTVVNTPAGTYAVANVAGGASTFMAGAEGKVSNGGIVDSWTINQDRAMINSSSGL